MTRRVLPAVGLVALLAACADGSGGRPDGYVEDHVDPGPDQVASALAGTYRSSAGDVWRGQRVWQDQDGLWVVVERQARGAAASSPVAYRVAFAGPSHYVATPHALSDGASGPDPLAGLAPGDLRADEACAITFRRIGPGDYAGSTEGTCPPQAAAAEQSALALVIEEGTLSVWDRQLAPDSSVVEGPGAPVVYERTVE